MKINGQVIKIISNKFTVLCDDKKEYVCAARGKIRQDTDIFVGDKVVVENCMILEILPRKNSLIRPFVSNIDVCIILVTTEPMFDGILVDKILLNCYKEDITPVLCFNKCEIANDSEIAKIFDAYPEVEKIKISAREKINLNALDKFLEGDKLVCLAGQSAVGKTSLLNSLLDSELKVGDLSKIKRGRNTTRHVEIFNLKEGKIIDTCGFSMLECVQLEPEELTYYYDEFLPFQEKCRFKSCSHIKEPDCAVKEAVDLGLINNDRYQRYVEIYDQLKERRFKKYD